MYKPTNPKLKPNLIAIVSLLSLGLAGSLAFYMTQLKTPPTSNLVSTQKSNSKPNKITLRLNPQNLNFPDQAVNTRSQKQNVTIINKGSILLQLSDMQSLNQQGDFEISSNTCPSSIAPNRSCNISIIFAPVQSGKHQANLSITNSDGKTIGQILIAGVATEQQEPFTDIAPAPQPNREKPLLLPQPRQFPGQIPQKLSTPPPIPKSIRKSPESIKFPIQFPTPIPDEQPTPQVTQFPQIESTTQPTPEVTPSPQIESTTQPTSEVTPSPQVESTTQPDPEATQFPQIQSQ